MLVMGLSEKLFVVFWLFLPLMTATAQYHFESWTTQNGLVQNSVRSIVKTQDGYLWLGTFEGLVRFDGVDFTTFDNVNTKLDFVQFDI